MTWTGMDPHTGRALRDDDHLRQSLATILTTPIGSRLARRRFGSQLPELLDRPLNGKTRMQAMSAAVMAITAWEPRVELSRVVLHTGAGAQAGQLTIDLELRRRDTGATARYALPVGGLA
ncbi:hypothetical protein BUE93_04920 [Chromobacterium amazonense]|uniref:IraD/Gp25-like domain-containing protein n=1 Tax=Chromobacterium amazonense TaxID=1382803 RepID=A0A2S9X7R2_9NEIS|nr:GPW/gp25 family protein [Chromobacterium amazonense]PRP71751.1 hypothetical protein BUE93_04920 [Chromobacterium amazonense]